MGEQLRRLRALRIPYSVTPGVPAFSAAAAALESELEAPLKRPPTIGIPVASKLSADFALSTATVR